MDNAVVGRFKNQFFRRYLTSGLPLILLVALLVRLSYLVLIVGPHTFPLNIDSIEHHMIAKNVVEGRGYTLYGQPSAYRAPFLTYYMVCSYQIFGESFLLVRLGIILMSLILVGIIYSLGKEIFNQRVARWAAAIAAIYPHMIFYNSRIFTETPFTLFSLLALLFFIRFMRSASTKNLLLISLFSSLAILTRPVGFVLLGFMILCILFKQQIRPALRNTISLIVLTGVVILPWTLRNYRVFDQLMLVTTQGGVVLWVSNNHYIAHHPYYYGMHRLYQYLPGAANLIPDDEIARSRYARQYTWKFLRDYPQDIPRLVWNKARRFWEKDFSTGSARRWLYEYAYLLLLCFAIAGMILTFRSANTNLMYLWMLLLANFLPALVFWAGARIRLPAEPVLMLFAAAFLDKIFSGRVLAWKIHNHEDHAGKAERYKDI